MKAPANPLSTGHQPENWIGYTANRPNHGVPTPLVERFLIAGFRSTPCCGNKHIFTLLRHQCFLIALHFLGSDGSHMPPFDAGSTTHFCQNGWRLQIQHGHHRVFTPHISRSRAFFQLAVDDAWQPGNLASSTTIRSRIHGSSGIGGDNPGYGVTAQSLKRSPSIPTFVFSSGPLSHKELVVLNILDHIQTAPSTPSYCCPPQAS